MATKREKESSYNPGIQPYHELGPTVDLSDPMITGKLVDVVSGRLYPEVVSPSEQVSQWRHNMMNPSLYVDAVQDPVVASDIVCAYKDIGDSCESQGQMPTARMLYEASLVVQGARIEKPSASELLAINETRDWLSARGYARSGQEAQAVPARKRRIEIFNKILAERRVRSDGLKDGPAFEMALMAILQYDHYSEEVEDTQKLARMARTREDMPARGMKPEKGTRVSHDVVYVREGRTYRIQAKFGADAGDAATDRYDKSIITEICEDNMSTAELTEVFNILICAYNDDPDASQKILTLADKYKSRILGTRTYASSKIINLANG